MAQEKQDASAPDQAAADRPVLRMVFLGSDATNPTLILRIRSFLRAGADVTGFTFRRWKFNTDYQPEWANIHLGRTVDRNYLRRLPSLLRALYVVAQHRQVLRRADVIYARQIDLLLLGLLGKWLSGSPARMVYEVEDIQEVFFKKTLQGKIFRWLERWALKHVDLLVPLSPGFLRGYFQPVQNYTGPSFVLENKIQLGDQSDEPTRAGRVWEEITDRWVIGWFGTLRCPKSMALLEEVAERLGPKVEIYTRGYPTETGLDAYMEIVNRHPNWTYAGEYTIPGDLEEMYGRVHFSWCLDFLDEHGNSPLLLACRMYQGGFYGAVPLVPAGSEMDRWVSEAGIGHALPAPYAEPIARFLENTTVEAYREERAEIMDRRRDLFLEDGTDTRALLDTIREIAPSYAGFKKL
ncbi:hypothetical protein M3P21_19130 [Ruegeria sp. 2012CJ41-6]|uniref:Glycosyltransferase subfamily 4-like N-terminal domain-containing protein n=1 Tax=Ruegeria spongiae TaxID=2942209 RepID=A0ABT0Q6Z4_9RHOB|nr:glycosyltransferase [Ruegeria spongiae]MCL6285646.1 hypothetical protein [Ruegeria spongiae]